MEDMRKKRLRFNYDEPFLSRHVCMKLFRLEFENDDVRDKEDARDGRHNSETFHIEACRRASILEGEKCYIHEKEWDPWEQQEFESIIK